MPDTLWWTNVMGVDMLKYLINFTDLQGGGIMTLVYVLVNVLDGLDRGADLNVDMAVIPGRQERVVGNDVTVVKGLTPAVGVGATIVWPGIFWIAIFTETCFRAKLLWKMLAANSIDHAGCIWMFRTAGTVGHALCDGLVEHQLGDRVRDLSGDNGVYMSSVTYLVLLLQKYKEMDVRQATLLKLYGEDKAKDISGV